MTAFAFGGDPAQLTMAEEILRECVGFMDIEKKFEGVWIAYFEDLESARTAQWILEINGSEGRRAHGPADETSTGGGDPGDEGHGRGAADYAADGTHGETAAGDGGSTAGLD